MKIALIALLALACCCAGFLLGRGIAPKEKILQANPAYVLPLPSKMLKENITCWLITGEEARKKVKGEFVCVDCSNSVSEQGGAK